MSFGRGGRNFGVVVAAVVALLSLTPGASSEHLEEPGHDHEDSSRIAVAAVHTTLPAHFDASSATAERVCSACVLHDRTVVRQAPPSGTEPLPPTVPTGPPVYAWSPGKPQTRLDLSRAPPSIL